MSLPLIRFWYDVTTRLNRLRNRLSPQERARLGAAIANRVGGRLLTPAEIRGFERGRERMLGRLRAANGAIGNKRMSK